MNKTIMVFAALLSCSLVAEDVDARRLGGGTSIGRQRSTITQPAPTPPQQAPSAAPANPAQQPQPSGMSRWLGPLAGLAIGAGLASLFMNNGAFGGILMILLIAAVAMFVLRMLRSKPQPGPLQYAGAGAPGAISDISTGFGSVAAAPDRYPPGFDAEQFARHAKLNFTRLQAANDQHDLSTMRDFMTPEMYAAIAADIDVHGNEKTDVVTLDAEVLEVVTEGDHYVASVRFSGMLREQADAAAGPFSEVWHLEKPLNGGTGWLIAGIQQD
jgi:predicted lipid-binding transport protein (Tim44 family)